MEQYPEYVQYRDVKVCMHGPGYSLTTPSGLHHLYLCFSILTLCRRHTDVLSEEGAPDSASLDPPGYRLGHLLDAQVDQLTQGKRHNHFQSLAR